MKQLFIFLLLCSLGFSQQIVQTETHEDGYIEVINYYKKKRSSSGGFKIIKVKSEEYYDSGNLYKVKYFNEDGEQNGPYKSYYENGQLEWEYHTINDDRVDHTKKVKLWFENGQLYQEGFVDESGYYWKTRKTYSEEGKLEKEETFKDGDVIESKEY
tara:strand:- start:409 stop:879 length:471 start_codon:yes stop_codon:yes gene_type:complete